MNYSDLVTDFAGRTLDNYQNYQGDYDVTQLINSMIGLLVFPKEMCFKKQQDKLNDTLISKNLLDSMQRCVVENKENGLDLGTANLRDIVRHMRNALAHGGFEANTHDPKVETIKKITFTDDYTRGPIHTVFKITVSIDLLREFLIEFAKAVINLK